MDQPIWTDLEVLTPYQRAQSEECKDNLTGSLSVSRSEVMKYELSHSILGQTIV